MTILTEAPGMDPLEIEALVTFPIESALNGAAGVRRVRSATAVGVAVVWVEFDWGQDIARARQTVTEKLHARVRRAAARRWSRRSSPRCRRSWARCCSSTSSRTGIRRMELRTVAETVVRRRLLAVPGVSQVIATGGDQKQYEVVLDPARLASHAVTLDEVEHALTAANRNATAGFQVAEGQEYLIRGVGRLSDTDAIAARGGAHDRRACRCWSATSGWCGKAPPSSAARAPTTRGRPSSWASRSSPTSTRSS